MCGMLPLAMVQAAPADALLLARQVNEQIVHTHMREEVHAFAGAFNGSTMMPPDVPEGCRAQMREAVTGMYTAMTDHLKAVLRIRPISARSSSSLPTSIPATSCRRFWHVVPAPISLRCRQRSCQDRD